MQECTNIFYPFQKSESPHILLLLLYALEIMVPRTFSTFKACHSTSKTPLYQLAKTKLSCMGLAFVSHLLGKEQRNRKLQMNTGSAEDSFYWGVGFTEPSLNLLFTLSVIHLF